MFRIIALLAFQFHFQEKNNNVDRFRSDALKQIGVNITNTKKKKKNLEIITFRKQCLICYCSRSILWCMFGLVFQISQTCRTATGWVKG